MRRVTRQLRLAFALALALAGLGASPASPEESGLGGGSDIRAGTVIETAAGTSIPPVHHVFADNPEAQSIEVEFRAEAPPGIEIVPELTRFPIAQGESVRVPFSIRVEDVAPGGDHPVTVQLVRSDIIAEPGKLTNIPAVGTNFVLRVVGEAANVTVEARSEQSGQPVAGTLTLAAIIGPAATFEVARVDGTELSARVAPGAYRAAYLLAGRELAAAEVRIAAGASERILLVVRSVSFVLVSARPIEEAGKVVVAELVASVENHLEPIDGPVTIRATVHRDGQQVDTTTLDEFDGLPLGVTEASLTYRPPGGFAEGEYRFFFELVTEAFTLQESAKPSFDVNGRSPFPPLLLGVGGAGVVIGSAAGWWLLRRRSRRAGRSHT